MNEACQRPLFGKVTPHDNETLLSIISRSAEANVHPTLVSFLRLSGIETLRPGYVPFTKLGHAGPLAVRLGLELDTVRRRMHMALADTASVDWYGTSMPRSLIESVIYEFSPTSLRKSAFQRAQWTIRPLGFCPESMELLISTCSCGRKQAWKYRSSMDVCEKCRAPLTELKSAIVPTELQPDARLAAMLASPNADKRAAAIKSFPKPFSDWGAGEILSAVVELGAVVNEAKTHRLIQKVKNGDFSEFTVEHLVDGVRLVRSWPNGFAELVPNLVDMMSCDLSKCIGPLSRYFLKSSAPTKLRDLIRSETENSLNRIGMPVRGSRNLRARWILPTGTINQKDATQKYHIDNRTLRFLETSPQSPTKAACARGQCLYDEAALAKSIAIWRDAVTTTQCSKLLNIPDCFLEALVRRKHIALVDDVDALSLAREKLYDGDSVRSLLTKVAHYSPNSGQGITVSQMLRHRFHPEDWADAVDGLLNGSLRTVIVDGCGVGEIVVDSMDANNFLRQLPERPVSPGICVSIGTAGQLLALYEIGLRSVIAERLLIGRITGKNRVEILLSEIASFDQNYFIGTEARTHFGFDSRTLANLMRTAGYSPIPNIKNTRIWRREDVRHVMAKTAVARAPAKSSRDTPRNVSSIEISPFG